MVPRHFGIANRVLGYNSPTPPPPTYFQKTLKCFQNFKLTFQIYKIDNDDNIHFLYLLSLSL